MKRIQLLYLLSNYQISFPEDGEIAARTALFVRENPQCFERSLVEGHITGSAWIVDKERTHALFTHHRKLNTWLQLGGHADGESDILQVALKEAREESGLQNISALSGQIFDVDINLILDGSSSHYHYDIRFLLEADRSEELVISDESHDLAWIELSKAESTITESSVLRMYSKMRLFFK
jgi:8-oxo-dGTP pyrophosphatase MutT (NUDIX family)